MHSSLPSSLESVRPFVDRSDELREHSPAVALSCLTFALRSARELGIPPEGQSWQHETEAQIEHLERQLHGVDLRLACETFAVQLMHNAGRADFAGTGDLNLAQAYLVASQVIEASTAFGALDEALKSHQLFCTSRVQDIRRCAILDSASASASLSASAAPGTSLVFVPAREQLSSGQATTYLGADGSAKPAVIVAAHRDADELYYTVLVDGAERGTTASRLGSFQPALAPALASCAVAPESQESEMRRSSTQLQPSIPTTHVPMPMMTSAIAQDAASIAFAPPSSVAVRSSDDVAQPLMSLSAAAMRTRSRVRQGDPSPPARGYGVGAPGLDSGLDFAQRAAQLEPSPQPLVAAASPGPGVQHSPTPTVSTFQTVYRPLDSIVSSQPSFTTIPPHLIPPQASMAAAPMSPRVQSHAAGAFPPSACGAVGTTSSGPSDIYAIFDAQSEARLAVSAIEFRDRDRAVNHLLRALSLLTVITT